MVAIRACAGQYLILTLFATAPRRSVIAVTASIPDAMEFTAVDGSRRLWAPGEGWHAPVRVVARTSLPFQAEPFSRCRRLCNLQPEAAGGNSPSGGGLPAGFLYTGDEAGRGHFAELNARYAKLTHVTLGAPCQQTAIVQTHNRSVLGQQLKSLIVTGFFKLGFLGGILLDKLGTLNLAGLH